MRNNMAEYSCTCGLSFARLSDLDWHVAVEHDNKLCEACEAQGGTDRRPCLECGGSGIIYSPHDGSRSLCTECDQGAP